MPRRFGLIGIEEIYHDSKSGKDKADMKRIGVSKIPYHSQNCRFKCTCNLELPPRKMREHVQEEHTN